MYACAATTLSKSSWAFLYLATGAQHRALLLEDLDECRIERSTPFEEVDHADFGCGQVGMTELGMADG
jgi:hypothetical protein